MNYDKPHYRWNGQRYVIMANEIVKQENAAVPDWMREASTGASIGNIDASDLKPPRLKVLAGMSPEVMDGVPNALPGNFWLTILNLNLGKEVTGSPIMLKKTYQLWAPRVSGGEVKGPLATASDAIHWDIPNQVFEVQFQGNPKIYKWHIKNTVFENRMNEFGSSQDDNPDSKPAAILTYDVLWLIDMPHGRKQLCVFTNSRTGTAKTQNFITATKAMGVDHFYQRYRIGIQKKTGPSGDPYFTYDYNYLGNVQNQQEAKEHRALYDQYSNSGFVTDVAAEADALQAEKIRKWGKPPSEDDKEEIPF
jgi:hypothetical protein